MQKLNLKYFMGSFFLSLVAVFMATKVYIVMTLSAQTEENKTAVIETKNIELFAATEENDPIYEKYKRLSAAESPLGTVDTVPMNTVSASPSDDNAVEGTVLYAENNADGWIKGDENFAEQTNDNNLSTAFSTDITPDVTIAEETADTAENSELQIADASTAPNFAIPLKHNFKIETGVVSVSDEADGGRIALASKNVSIYNLGTDNTAAVTEPLATDNEDTLSTQSTDVDNNSVEEAYSPNADDAWEVAETANKHITKNTFGVKSEPLQQDVTLPDAQAKDEAKVAYTPQQNILIPIPEDILNNENLTPQFSTSKENLEIEQELRDKHQLPELLPEERLQNKNNRSTDGNGNNDSGTIQSIDDEKDFDNDDDGDDIDDVDGGDDEAAHGYLDRINSWFSGSIRGKSADSATKSKKDGSAGKGRQGSIFQRLFDKKDSQENIVPTELKLSFQPNRAEISGQTLEWLHAFADNAVNNDNVVVEIRVDRSASFEVQQKRLKMLYKILEDNGVDQRKVNIMFTDREPNSFIIRNVRYATDEARIEATKHADNPWF